MKAFIVQQLLRPIAARVGAIVSGVLVAKLGAETDVANQIATGATALAFLLVDLLTRQSLTVGK